MNRRSLRRRILNGIVRIHRAFSPAERQFQRFFPEVDQIEGFLRSPIQERWLFKAALSVPAVGNVVEIGSFKGRSTACLGMGCRGQNKKVWAIDVFQGDGIQYGNGSFIDEFLKNIECLDLGDVVNPVCGRSAEAASNWDHPIHLLFIDGSHEYEDVVADFSHFFPHVVTGGIVAFHDVSPREPGVLKAWREVISPELIRIGHCSSLAFGRKPGYTVGFKPFFEEALYRRSDALW